MNIGIHIDSRINPTWGGGHSYAERVIELLRSCSGSDEINYVAVHEKHSQDAVCYGKDLVTLEKFKFQSGYKISGLLYKKKRFNTENAYEKYVSEELSRNDISLMYYPHQHRCISLDVPFVVTNWDLAHITAYAFPELSGGHFDVRRAWYEEYIHRALLIFVESQAGKQELMEYLKIPATKIKTIPMFPGKVVEIDVEEKKQQEILVGLKLQKGQYFLYPAQFWAVKNHYNLIKAFSRFSDQDTEEVKLVFTGTEKGNLNYIKEIVESLGLADRVLFLGFVDSEVLNTLYKKAISLVFPTFLGPTNMPIVEAMALGCPVICSDFDGHKEQASDAAIYVDPMDISDIAEKMKLVCFDESLRKIMSEKGLSQMKSLNLSADKTAERLHENLLSAKQIINLWRC